MVFFQIFVISISIQAILCSFTPSPPGAATTCHLGIRYAEAPVGDLRWKPPVPLTNNTNHLLGCAQGKKFAATCPQNGNRNDPWLQDMSEDCLFLNVFTPSAGKPGSKFPVMVFFYGGSYKTGTSSIPIYNGQSIASMSKDTVIVTVNYRLGALGFLALEKLQHEDPLFQSTGNYGLLDQIASLLWVYFNIKQFGGDRANVTIFGESAGAAAVCALMVSPLAEGLFQKAIMESGLCQDVRPGNNFDQGNEFAKLVSCAADDLKCMRQVPWENIIAQQVNAPNIPKSDTKWAPTADDFVLADKPITLIAQDKMIKSLKHVIIGTNANESTIFNIVNPYLRKLKKIEAEALIEQSGMSAKRADAIISYYLEQFPSDLVFNGIHVTNASLAYSKAMTDFVFTCPSLFVADALSKSKRVTTYSYVFEHAPNCTLEEVPADLVPKIMGAFHSSELPYVFHTRANRKCTKSPSENYLSIRMVEYWSSFARSGVPQSTIPGNIGSWPAYGVSGESVSLDTPRDTVIKAFRSMNCDILGF